MARDSLATLVAFTLCASCGSAATPPDKPALSGTTGSAPATQPQQCTIGGAAFSADALNPSNPCELCAPAQSEAAWSRVPDRTACAQGTGTFCSSGNCIPACLIDGNLVQAGAPDADGGCLICAPALNPVGWADGGCPLTSCVVGDTSVPAGAANPANPCEICKPAASATGYTAVPDGLACDAGGDYCLLGLCTPGCQIDGSMVPAHTFAPGADTCCNPALSTTAWTPGFGAPELLPVGPVTSIATGDVNGDGIDDLALGTPASSVVIVAGVPDAGMGSGQRFPQIAPVTAVVTVDLERTGKNDVVALVGDVPTLVTRVGEWPAVYDAGGLWATNTDAGPQVLVATADYNPPDGGFPPSNDDAGLVPSYLIGEVQDAGRLIPWWPYSTDLGTCEPTGLAFGHFDTPSAVEAVADCGGVPYFLYYLTGDIPFAGQANVRVNKADAGVGPSHPVWAWSAGPAVSSRPLEGPLVAAGDLNQDGYDEVASSTASELRVWLNDRSGGQEAGLEQLLVQLLPVDAGVTALAFAALRADGGDLLAVTDVDNGQVLLYSGPSGFPELYADGGGFTDGGLVPLASYPAWSPLGLTVGDLNGDGRPDLATFSDAGVQVFFRQCP